MTVRNIIKSTMRLLGVIAQGETPTADEYQDAVSALNGMIDSWSNQSLLINSKTREVFNLISGQSSYTVGTGGNFNTSRPVSILNASYLLNNSEYPLDIITQQEYAQIQIKTLASQPSKLYASGTYPLDTINLYPVPNIAAQIVLYTIKPFADYTSLDTEIVLPPGYERALKYNLAVEIAPEYGKQISAEIATIAADSKAEIKRLNSESLYLTSDVVFLNNSKVFDINSGV